MYQPSNVPVVAIYNNLETFFKFLHRTDDSSIFEKRMYRGDRGIFWLGRNKLLIVTKSVPDADYICERWGYTGTTVLSPTKSTHQLSLNILQDADLIQKIVQYAGPQKTLQLIPYSTTEEFFALADHLRTSFGLNIILPESPSVPNLWIRDYIDTKIGFRSLVSEWTGDKNLLPPGFVCRSLKEATRAVQWFHERELGAVVKASGGESGLGHLVFPDPKTKPGKIFELLEADLFLMDDLILVDQLINSSVQLSPSLELFVPPVGQSPAITYVSSQLFSEFGLFAGVLLSRELAKATWYPQLADSGLKIAHHLQAMGYVGHFDIDAIVDDNGKLFLLEINARRTGGTYVHEFATLNFGANYLDEVALLCNNSINCKGITTLDELTESLDELLFPINGGKRGIVITVTSSLPMGEFGCILVAADEQDLLALKHEMVSRVQNSRVDKNYV